MIFLIHTESFRIKIFFSLMLFWQEIRVGLLGIMKTKQFSSLCKKKKNTIFPLVPRSLIQSFGDGKSIWLSTCTKKAAVKNAFEYDKQWHVRKQNKKNECVLALYDMLCTKKRNHGNELLSNQRHHGKAGYRDQRQFTWCHWEKQPRWQRETMTEELDHCLPKPEQGKEGGGLPASLVGERLETEGNEDLVVLSPGAVTALETK